MDNKPSWTDIPSLELSTEDKHDTSVKDIELRNAVRLVSQDLLKMLLGDFKKIYVQVRTREGVLQKKGILQDITGGGMCFCMNRHGIQKNDPIQIGTMLGSRPFKTHANVRWVSSHKVGVKYVTPKPDDVSFLSGLYSAKLLNRIKGQ